MSDSRLTRVVAVAVCGGFLWLGQELHSTGGGVDLATRRNAPAVDAAPSSAGPSTRVFTADQSGTHLYVWDVAANGNAKYIGSATAVQSTSPPRSTSGLMGQGFRTGQ